MKKRLAYKTLLFGDKNVGKSTLEFVTGDGCVYYKYNTTGLDLFLRDQYLDLNEKSYSLYFCKIIDVNKLENILRIISFDIVLLIFDISNINSLHFLFPYLEIIRKTVGEISLLLIGNKVDLQDKREVLKEKGHAFAQRNGLLGYSEFSVRSSLGSYNLMRLILTSLVYKFSKSEFDEKVKELFSKDFLNAPETNPDNLNYFT